MLKQIREAQEKVNKDYLEKIQAVELRIKEARTKAEALKDPLRSEYESKENSVYQRQLHFLNHI